MIVLHTTNAFAKVYMGKITLEVGDTYEVSAVPTSGYTASGSFSKSGTCFNITANGSYYCKIKANYVGKGTLSYWGSVAPSGSWSTYIYDYYWDIEVKAAPGPTPGPDPAPDPNPEPADNWLKSGNYSISWYNKNQTEFNLSTNKELAGLAYLLNNGYIQKDISIKLGADIDLSGKEWIPCGTFSGSFDGQGHTIEGIEITTFKEKQKTFGFFSYLGDKSSISNTTFKGYIYVKGINITSEDYLAFRVGGIAGSCHKSTIENCHCEMPITFGINDLTIPGVITHSYVYIGGLVGFGSYGSKISCCTHIGDIMNDSNESLGELYLGGIAGHYSGNISRSEHISDVIGTSSDAIYGSWLKPCIAGIAGYQRDGNIKFCRSIINKIVINSKKKITFGEFYISGISSDNTYSTTDINCYSLLSKVEISSNIDEKVLYYHFNGKGCFRNSDMATVGKNAASNDYSTSFTSAQMMTSAFLDELNLYPMLETDDGQVWTQDSNGGYPYIAELYNTTSINPPKVKDTVSGQSFYTLSGQRLAAPRKGINIVGGKKVIIR